MRLGVSRLSTLAVVSLLSCTSGEGTAQHTPGALGVRASSQTQAIQGGTVDTGDPAVVGILINSAQGVAVCTGSLIAPNLVMTAHHCVSDILSQNLVCDPNTFGGNYANSAFAVTPSYNAAALQFNNGTFPSINNSTWFGARAVWTPGNDICGGDMAMIELSAPVTGVCPIVPRVDSPVTVNETYRAVGFGITSPRGQSAGTRYSVTGMTVFCASNCAQDMSPTLEWEGGSTLAKGTCEGDSGGPALDSAGRVIGTVSRGPASACNDTVYESVFGLASWIKARATQAATDGAYAVAGWVTGAATSDPTSGYCTGGGTGGGSGGGGAGGGTGGGTGGGGVGGGTGGGGAGVCSNPAWQCIDVTGMGDYECLDPSTSTGFPPGLPQCQSDANCTAGHSCWFASSTATTGRCLENCGATGTGGGAGGGTGGGVGGGAGGGTGGGGGATGGPCTVAGLQCVDASGAGDYACLDPATATGFPTNAMSCTSSAGCPANYACWRTSSTSNQGKCLQWCTPGATGGGAGGGTGGGAAGGGTGGAAGGGTGGAAGGGTGGAAGGGTGGAAGGGAGGAAGGGTGGAAGGGTGGAAGGGTGTGGGSGGGSSDAGTGGGLGGGGGAMNIASAGGCSCSETNAGTMVTWFGLLGLALVAGRRRRHAA
jgi:hypothetical protein